MNGRLCIEEVGVDLELSVHAHGPDVELIKEASCKTFNQLDNSSGVFELDPLQLWFRPYWYSLIPFLGQVKVLVFCRSIHLSTLYSTLPSGITPWYLKDINPLHFILGISDEVIPFPVIVTPRVLGCRQPKTPGGESNQHWDSVLPVLCCWEF